MLLTLLSLLIAVAPWAPLIGPQADAAPPQQAPVDATGLGAGPYATMEMLYERTIFRVDVLHLSLRFGPDTEAALERLVAGQEYRSELVGPVTDAALQARDVLVRSYFLRSITLDQYLDGMAENLEHAREAGLVTAAEEAEIFAAVRTEWEPIRQRGIREGDTVWYRIRGDTLQIALEAADGERPVELVAEGERHRRAVLGGYLAPESAFRDPLVRSLFGTAD